MLDDYPTDMRNLGRNHAGTAFFQLELQAREVLGLGEQARSFVLASPSLRKAVRGVSVASVHQRTNELPRVTPTGLPPVPDALDM
ncbi:hypothetical protein AKJ09_07401 [Labilithrix luteola]|uniref:Uncharacterized protein n=1 Tax=Labilithrix luteola TaxID=1391654 RepID=A0A0K1Q4T8_9BACT|nr:hypothetical protein AKJ09_07401 [Labilithrix luteola]